MRLAAIILATLPFIKNQPQFTIKAEKNKAFDTSCLIDSLNYGSGSIEDCLEHCLENCRCQSFQICQNTRCQLCSSHNKENSSLLHDKDGCVYAIYDVPYLQRTSKKNFDGHCSGMSCSMNSNCCQQSGVCSSNKICKPFNSLAKPWKRFTCVCPDGYRADNCDQRITSCQGYAKRSRKSGRYKILDSNNVLYEVYCHFDSNGAWTLVQSFSFAKRAVPNSPFGEPLTDDAPVGQNTQPSWTAYRLSKARIQTININSDHLRFTCGFDYVDDVNQTDYIQMSLDEFGPSNDFTIHDPNKVVISYSGKIQEKDLKGCKIKLHQDNKGLHVHIDAEDACAFVPEGKPTGCSHFHYFSTFNGASCMVPTHRCTLDQLSTSQLWFGKVQA